MFRKLLDRGEAGDNVGVLLRGVLPCHAVLAQAAVHERAGAADAAVPLRRTAAERCGPAFDRPERASWGLLVRMTSIGGAENGA